MRQRSSTCASTSARAVADGLHELCSLTDALTLSDRIVIGDARRDEVGATASTALNLAARALEALRERGWSRPPLSIEIEKRIPIAAGLGGGAPTPPRCFAWRATR